MLRLIRASLWGTEAEKATWETYEEMKVHAIVAIPALLLTKLELSSDLRNVWTETIYRQVFYYMNYMRAEANLPISVPYVILKGSAAAKYYPYPEYRTMGDIDIMTSREDYGAACSMLLEDGYIENTTKEARDFGRHRGFTKNGIEVEVHSFFALHNNKKEAEYLDELILNNINPSHYLPDMINGVILLEHINQHLESGLGLRQIIDWMMFVNKCLTDNEWQVFCNMAQKAGLKKLAIVTTRMCEIYLGLSEHAWCSRADHDQCKRLLDYIIACGNFGNKYRTANDSQTATNVLLFAHSPIAFFRLLQERGRINWGMAQKYVFLRPFSWIYQGVRYVKMGTDREKALAKLIDEYEEARQRKMLFDSLDVKQTSKGLIRYENGHYVKTKKKP